ncbi:hypothetical protein [uncultured Pseudosulfitobacter sp.]|uniref:hypothetical protein n=1 Tax=uncultured Pseudosulfitobacter sp. TaxID=2854214 RepID=UPI0030DCD9D5|tara:strand:- start:459 stop:854 length:396 start_codon:yes stop_codon:yes gene_type:complete
MQGALPAKVVLHSLFLRRVHFLGRLGMFGVVLWCDFANRKAVILCEDHVELAFFQAAESMQDGVFGFDVGDLVSFDLRTDVSPRLAENVKLYVAHTPCAPQPLSVAPARNDQRAKTIAFPRHQPWAAPKRA